ncbi:MAG: hypothetical protein QOH61_1555 [Chloroflexota bacterium]|jgi:hypothetical protein|nr:hypothetical protein [Chloroflexota bacterium]
MAVDSLMTHHPTRRRLDVSWLTVGLCALVLAAADGFWATSLRGAVGYIEATQQPFPDWIRYIAVMLPIDGAAVFGAFWLAHRLIARRTFLRVAAAAVLVVVLTTALGGAQVVLTSVYDYRMQANQLVLMHRVHEHGNVAPRVDQGAAVPTVVSACDGTCSAKQATVAVHLRALGLVSVLFLVTNSVLVLWALAMRGGRIWKPKGGRRLTSAP